MNDQLSKPTAIFGLRLWVVLGFCLGAGFVLVLFFISLCLAFKRSKNKSSQKPTIPIVSKDIQEVRVIDHSHTNRPKKTQIEADPFPESDPNPVTDREFLLPHPEEESPFGYNRRIQIDIGKGHRICYPERFGGSSGNGGGIDQVGMVGPEVSHLGWGHWYTLRELEASTNGFGPENVIGQGGDGIVYHGVLGNDSQVAVKNLLNNRCEFISFLVHNLVVFGY